MSNDDDHNNNKNPPSKWSDIEDNMCEICGRQATAGILDEDKYIQTRIRYTCQDHYMQIYDRIANEKMSKKNNNNDNKR